MIWSDFCSSSFLTRRAENGTRTRDLNLGKVALYQLSYFRITLQTFRFVNLSLFIREVLFTPPDVCEPCNLEESLSLSDCECKDMSKKLFSKTFVIFFAILF